MSKHIVLFSILAVSAFAQTKPGDVANGKRLFDKDGCYQCHGYVGQGGTSGPRLAQTRFPLAEIGRAHV